MLQQGVIPSIFPLPESYEKSETSDNGPCSIDIEFSDENNQDIALGSVDIMEKESNTVCKKCVDSDIDLMKAKKMISLLEEKITKQKKIISKYKKTISKLQNEKGHLEMVR